MRVTFLLVTAILNLPARAVFAQMSPPSENALTCRVLSSVRAEKVGAGFFTYTASEPDKATGVVLLVELAYPPTLTAVDSSDFSLRYTGAATEGAAVSSGFDSLPNKNDILDQDITWVLHATSSQRDSPLQEPRVRGARVHSRQAEMTRLKTCGFTLAVLLTATEAAAQPRATKDAIPQDAPADIRDLLEQCFSPPASIRGDSAKKLGERAGQALAAVPVLIAMLGDEESYMDSIKIGTMVIHGMSSPGRQSAVALGSIGGSAVEPLLDILRNKAVANRDMAALALGGAKDPKAVTLLVDALTEKDDRLRAEAAAALGGFKDFRAVQPLITALGDGDEKVAARAHESLRELTAQTFGKDAAQWQVWWQGQKKQ